MKKRIWNQAAGLGMSAVLLSAMSFGNGGEVLEIRAADMNHPGITLTQTAQWTDREAYKAEIMLTVGGLGGYREKFTQIPVGNPEEEENPEGNSGENSEEYTGEENGEITAEGFEPDGEGNTAADMEESFEENSEIQETLPEVKLTEVDAASEKALSEDAEGNRDADSTENFLIEETDEPEEDIRTECVDFVENAEGEYAQMTYEPEELFFAEAGVSGQSIPELVVVDYISEYFRPDTEFLPQSCRTEEIAVVTQSGADASITKAVCPIDVTSFSEDVFQIIYPVVLREEYRTNADDMSYPVSQDEPLMKDCPGTGAFVLEQTENGSTLAAQAASPRLDVPAAVSDFGMELKTDAADLKAGQSYTYVLNVTNTGELPLSDIRVKSTFSIEEIKAVWESGSGVSVNGKEAVIPTLSEGEKRTLYMTVKLTEDQSGDLTHTVYAETSRPGGSGELLVREAEKKLRITPLTADFTVEKTADRTEAYPGDTITYQICIRNTGERTLHSVLSTERFLSANIQAQFMPKDGVVLNSTRTQALIREIAPGEAFGLLATVTLPGYFRNQELVNQVTVVTEETGNRSVQSESEITVGAPLLTPTGQPFGAQTYYASEPGTKSAYAAASKPKTGDNTEAGLFVVLLIFAAMSAAGVRHSRSQKNNKE